MSPAPNQLTVVIADDHPMFRDGVRTAIGKDSNLSIVAEAGTGTDALRFITELKPRLAVLDIRMPGLTGLAVAKELFRAESATSVVILTMHDDDELFDAAMDVDVKGYVLKDCVSSDIVTAIHTVASGGYYISPKLSGKMVSRRSTIKQLETDFPDINSLTETERKVLRMIADGKTSKDIAGELFISSRTVDNHRTHIAKKLGVQGSFSLLKFAVENRKIL